jgi:hypothetical protein
MPNAGRQRPRSVGRGFSRTGPSGYENLNSSTKAHLCKSGHRMFAPGFTEADLITTSVSPIINCQIEFLSANRHGPLTLIIRWAAQRSWSIPVARC